MIPPIHRVIPAQTRILLLERIHPLAAQQLEEAGYSVEELPASLQGRELSSALEGVAVLGVRSKTRLAREILEEADALLAVGAFCIGTGKIDLEAAAERGIPVFNAPFGNTRSVVELALGQMFVLMRDLCSKSRLMHEGVWQKRSPGARELRGKRLGIIGYGNIGAQLSVLAEGLGMEVRYFDVAEKLPMGNARPLRTLEELLETSDVVTVHVDGGRSTRGLIGREELARMKREAILINLARGDVVDAEALRESLLQGRLRGAAVDVFPTEPPEDGAPFSSPLQGIPNVVLTPHIGGSTEEAQENIGRYMSSKLLGFLERGATDLSCNFPELRLPALQESHRVLHIHRNLPGVLARINRILADRDINISAQYLTTNERIGYVITDIAQDYDAAVVAELRGIPETIRIRVLY